MREPPRMHVRKPEGHPTAEIRALSKASLHQLRWFQMSRGRSSSVGIVEATMPVSSKPTATLTLLNAFSTKHSKMLCAAARKQRRRSAPRRER